ncbi:MAG TPA: hypothetical protein VF452_11105 [Candidatus Binatia bacterium]
MKQLLKISEGNVPYRTYFELGTKKMPPVFLDDERYGKAIQSLIVVAADAVPINKERRTLYLAKRIVKPILGWWELGGRILRGEPESEAISRIVKREASIEVSPERFILVSQGRYFLKDRQQEPQDAGNDTLCYHFAVELTDPELRVASANLDEKGFKEVAVLRNLIGQKSSKRMWSSPSWIFTTQFFPDGPGTLDTGGHLVPNQRSYGMTAVGYRWLPALASDAIFGAHARGAIVRLVCLLRYPPNAFWRIVLE